MTKKLILGAAIALVVLIAGASSAAAFTATVSPAGAITATSLGTVTFQSGETTIACNLTLRGTLARTVVLTAGQSLGSTETITARECSNGATVSILRLPYGMTYQSVAGTLPDNATALRFNVVNAQFNLSLFGGFVNCLYAGNQPASLAAVDTGTNSYTTGLITITPTALNKVSGSLCPATGEMSGTFGLTRQTITVA